MHSKILFKTQLNKSKPCQFKSAANLASDYVVFHLDRGMCNASTGHI